MFLLDTNICIAFLNGTAQSVRTRLIATSPSDVALCSVVKAELLFGARNSAKVEASLTKLQQFFEPFLSLTFDDAAAEHYGVLRAQLSREGNPIGPNDLLIAAIARSHTTRRW